ncbi:MAG: DNA polymerase III subunit delta [Marinilabiliales bacterium]|nr:MAG: DNA polymerase III subunit delta [Marinilabiliales bacterium]
MPEKSFEDIISDIKQKNFSPVYYFYGDEGFFMDQLTEELSKNILPEEERSFNQTILYGGDVTLPDVVMAARRFPMMAEKQVIIVKEGQEISGIAGELKESEKAENKENPLTVYLEKPLESTILVINYRKSKLDKRTRFYKTLLKNGTVLESKKLYDKKLNAWIEKYIKSKGFDIVDQAVHLMAAYLGNDLDKLVNELNKLSVILPAKSTITATHIEKNVGISKDYNAFELWKAIATKNITKAHEIAFYFSKNTKDHHIAITITVLFNNFVTLLKYHQYAEKGTPPNAISQKLRLNYFMQQDMQAAYRNYQKSRVVRIISLLRHYDARSKGALGENTDTGELTKELIATILYY